MGPGLGTIQDDPNLRMSFSVALLSSSGKPPTLTEETRSSHMDPQKVSKK